MRVLWESVRTAWRLRGERVQRALRPAERLDPHFVAPIVVITSAGVMMSRINPRLATLCSAWIVSSNLRHGYVTCPAYSLSGFAVSVQALLHPWVDAQRLERASSQWLDEHPDPIFGPRAKLSIYATLRPWWQHRRPLLADLDRTALALQELGDREFYYYCRFIRIVGGALVGERVGDVARQLGEFCRLIERAGDRYREPSVFARPHRMLQLGEITPSALLEEIAASDREITATPGNAAANTRTLWALVLGVFGRWDLAFAQTQVVDVRRFGGQPQRTSFTLYRAVASSALAASATATHRGYHRKILRRALRHLRAWAKRGPDYAHMALWIEAELLQTRYASRRAIGLYQRAVREALEQEYPHHAALCSERLGHALLSMGRRSEALLALTQAINHYRSWGAVAKGAALTRAITELGLCRRSPTRRARSVRSR